MKLIEIKMEPFATLQIIPDRTLRNYTVDSVARAMTEFYTRPINRIKVRKPILINAEDRFSFRTVLTKEKISFYLLIPKRLKDFFTQKLLATWEKATVKEVKEPPLPIPEKSVCCELNYRRHDIFALRTDRDENGHIPALLTTLHDMQDNDLVIVDVLMFPVDRVAWEYDAGQAYEKFQKGKMPHRKEITPATVLGVGMGLLNDGLTSAQTTMIELSGGKVNKHLRPLDPEREMLAIKGLSTATTTKLHSPTLKTFIRIVAQSNSKQHAQLLCRAVAGAYRDLAGDNDLIRKDFSNTNNIIRMIAEHKAPVFGGNIMSCLEIGKLMSLPTGGLQEEFPQIESIGQKEVALPKELFQEQGIAIGEVTKGGITQVARIPVHDHNILCLPHISLGAMGTGKTTQDAVIALGFLNNGFSAVAIDVADGKLIDTIRDGLPEDFFDDHIIDLDFGNLEYPIPLNWSEITQRLGQGKITTIEARKAANRLTAQLVNFVDQLGAEPTPRMESYLAAAGKAVLVDPQNGLLEVILALTDKVYREKLFKSGISNPQAADTLRILHKTSDGMQQQIINPILDRLNLLLSNEAMANCLLQRGNPKINFRKWLDGDTRGPYFIGLRIPKDELLDIATDRIVTFLIAKVWLSVLSRYDIPEERRKPCVMVMDEPHQFMSSANLWSDMVREARKWRLKLYWSAHDFRDFKSLGKTMKDAGCQYSVFRTSKETYHDLGEELLPFEMNDLIRIPDRFYAVNKLVLPHTPNTPAFLAKMAPPPPKVKDRSYRREQCSKEFGRHIDLVERDIYQRRKVTEN